MIDLQLDITTLEDLKIAKNEYMQNDLLELGIKHLNAGNRVVVKRFYVNAPADYIISFIDSNKFKSFWQNLFA